ncbi:hypothetical protein D3C75_784870 [compost metagenome]
MGRIILDLLPQPAHMYVNDILISIIIIFPDQAVNLRLREHSARIRSEQLQDMEFLGGQLDLFPILQR